MKTLVVHGGAGSWSSADDQQVLATIERALRSSYQSLESGDSAVTAVLDAVSILEADPQFNAGLGSCLNVDGEVEMDAGVMRGTDGHAGAVANIRDVRHPVKVARDVMKELDHVLVGGEGAVEFARRFGHEPFDPVTEARREQYERRKERFLGGEDDYSLPRLQTLLREHPEWLGGTVGAVARDSTGQLAAATSTGGVFLKWPGRIGDTPLIGAGTYAHDRAAISATGHGETIARSLLSRSVADQIEEGETPSEAVREVLGRVGHRLGSHLGAIAVDARGRWGIHHDTERMPHGWRTAQNEGPSVAMTVNDSAR